MSRISYLESKRLTTSGYTKESGKNDARNENDLLENVLSDFLIAHWSMNRHIRYRNCL
jgi:hypothetical protein